MTSPSLLDLGRKPCAILRSTQVTRGIGAALVLALVGWSPSSSAQTAPGKPSLLVLPPPPPYEGKLLSATLAELGRSDRYRILLLPALVPLMREADERENVRGRATALIEEGRQLLVALDHQKAKAKLDAALQVLEGGFIRYYEPGAMAQVRLLLGIRALDRARPDLARREFEEAHQLDPALTLGAHYSPQVREAFNAARQSAAPRPMPSVADLRKLLRLAGAPAGVLLGAEAAGEAGERVLIRGAVFAAAKGSYTGVESLFVEPGNREALGRDTAALGARLRRIAEPLYPAPTTGPVIKNGGKPSKPWYRRWYTWVAAGAVVAGTVAIVLPLTIKREVVEGTLRW